MMICSVEVRIIPRLSVQGHCTAMRCFLWLLWGLLALMLSTLVVLNIASTSIPGFFGVGGIISKIINALIGAAQARMRETDRERERETKKKRERER